MRWVSKEVMKVATQGIGMLRGYPYGKMKPPINVADGRYFVSLGVAWIGGVMASTLTDAMSLGDASKLVGLHLLTLPVVTLVTNTRRKESLLDWLGLYRLNCLTAAWYPIAGIGWVLIGQPGLLLLSLWYLWAVTVYTRHPVPIT